jgi:hypothetical protein
MLTGSGVSGRKILALKGAEMITSDKDGYKNDDFIPPESIMFFRHLYRRHAATMIYC